MIPNVKPWKVFIAICAVDVISIIVAITAASLRGATNDFKFKHRDDKDE